MRKTRSSWIEPSARDTSCATTADVQQWNLRTCHAEKQEEEADVDA